MIPLHATQATQTADHRRWAQSDPDARPSEVPPPMVSIRERSDERRVDQTEDQEPAVPESRRRRKSASRR
jgi:hypothetical protein